MRILVVCRPVQGVGREQIAPLAADELAALRELKALGALLEAYSPGGPGAILVFDSEAGDLDAFLAALPLYREGLIEVERIELHPFDL